MILSMMTESRLLAHLQRNSGKMDPSCRWLGTPVLLTLISLHGLGCCNMFARFFVKQFILRKNESNSCAPN